MKDEGQARPLWPLILALLFSSLILHPSSFAQEDEPAPPKKAGVRITFLPPPMDGALSLGIYDKKGKLIRVLAREATKKDFFVGLNGFVTNWDGKDDAGKPAPAGTYSARGFAVGELSVEGELVEVVHHLVIRFFCCPRLK